METLTCAVSTLQTQMRLYPGIVHKLSRDEGTINVSVFPPGTQRDEDILSFSILFVTADEYPASQAWLMSDNEAICDMLNAVADEFVHGATLELVLTRVLMLIGHEPDGVQNLFIPVETADMSEGYVDMDDYEESDIMDEDTFDGIDVEFEEEDRELMITLGHHQGLWERYEETYERSQEGQQAKEELSLKEKVAEGRQIFDSKTAFKLLCKDLLEIMREQSCEVMVEAIDNDVYSWAVELAGFDTSSALYADLMRLCDLHGYSTVQLHITFKRGLHPFYPPKVEMIRPRFLGPVAWAVSSHPMLQLANWDPWRSQKEMLLAIRDFIQTNARVDVSSAYNSLVNFPQAAYSPAEIHLARLEGLLEVNPRCANFPENKKLYEDRNVHVDKARLAALGHTKSTTPLNNRKKDDQARARHYWAAGTGFGHGYERGEAKVWDAKKAAAAQKARDIETERLLQELRESLAIELAAKTQEETSTHQGLTNALIPTLNDSCLIPFLLKELGNVSFTNMCERAEYYLSVVNLIKELCHPLSARILHNSEPEECSVYSCLCVLEEQAQCYTKILTKPGNPSGSVNAPGTPRRRRGGSSSSKSTAEKEERLGIELADSIIVCVMALKELNCAEAGKSSEDHHASDNMEPHDDGYIKAMKQFQIDLDTDLGECHKFAKEASNEQSFPRDRLVRLSREIAGLGSLLPLTPSSSVFVRVDEAKQTLWSALIVGPEDTPYSGGCFVFDIYFPPRYPNTSPKVLLTTTGGGRVRFNPNLYKNGKVCLSLLGTWAGAAGETWDPNASSICQVLISIQSLILVNEPYFNEPGYEETMHTEGGRQNSQYYNQDIREQTIHRAMLDHLKSPPEPFATVIYAHFKLRKSKILESCHKWTEEANTSGNTAHAGRLKTLVQELTERLNDIA